MVRIRVGLRFRFRVWVYVEGLYRDTIDNGQSVRMYVSVSVSDGIRLGLVLMLGFELWWVRVSF